MKADKMSNDFPGETVIRITGKKKDDRGMMVDQIFRLLSAMDAPIRQLVTEKNELEEIFLEATDIWRNNGYKLNWVDATFGTLIMQQIPPAKNRSRNEQWTVFQ